MIIQQAGNSGAFRIASHIVRDPVALAPMSGISDRPFRAAVLQYGRGYAVSEMIASDRLVAGEAAAHLKLEAIDNQFNIVQIAGCLPELVAEGARIAVDGGADIIDINMGCPAKRVIGGYAGSALMRDLDHVVRIIEAVVAASSVPVTLKMRLGWDDTTINAPELARLAQDCGVELVTVHGRTRQQFYKGRADWMKIAAVREAISIPLVVNGDIHDPESARTALKQSGADAVMIGRAAVGKPWLLAEIAADLAGESYHPPDLDQQFAGLIALCHDLSRHYGPEVGLRHARKHIAASLDVALATSGIDAHLIADQRRSALTSNQAHVVKETLSTIHAYLSLRRAA